MVNDLCFVSKRSDGLGERLRAILNAFALSRVYEAQFYFFWDGDKFNRDGHSIDVKENIFSSEFLEKYHVDPSALQEAKSVSVFFDSGESGVYFCDQIIAKSLFKKDGEYAQFLFELGEAFASLAFSDSVNRAIAAAREVNFNSDCVAIHMRAGDLIYGPYQDCLGYAIKALSFPVIEKIVNENIDGGKKIILFGQDRELINHLSNKSGVVSSEIYRNYSLDRVQSAFFDCILMSRCERIYGGASGFSILASIIGGVEFIRPHQKYGNTEIATVIYNSLVFERSFVHLSYEQKKYAAKSLLFFGFKSLTDEQLERFFLFVNSELPNEILFKLAEFYFYCIKHATLKSNDIATGLLERKKDVEKLIYLNGRSPSLKNSFLDLFDLKLIHNKEHNEIFALLSAI